MGKKKMYLPENLLEIQGYKPATLRTGKEWFVEYYVYNPILRVMSRKKIKLNHIDKKAARRDYAYGLIKRLNVELDRGWNPFLEDQNSKSYSLLTKAIEEFLKLNKKKFEEGNLRQMTINAYVSKMKILQDYLQLKKCKDMYVYNFSKDFIINFLDYIYEERGTKSRTRDNYLKTIRIFCLYLIERGYLKSNPSEGITVLGKSKRGVKNRTVITPEIREQISEYLSTHNKHFLLASQILYFCMVRPREMSYIKIKHIDIQKATLFIPGETAKNYKDAVVTMPQSLISLIRELKVLDNPPEYFLFSDGFEPGRVYRRIKQFADFWARKVRPALDLPLSIQFYSLKDTGITDMIRKYNDPIIARDQARHHDLSITNIYTPQDMMEANDRIKNDESKF